MAFDFEKEHLELARLQILYDDTYEKYEKRIDRIKNRRDEAITTIWNSILEQKSLIVNNGGVLNDVNIKGEKI